MHVSSLLLRRLPLFSWGILTVALCRLQWGCGMLAHSTIPKTTIKMLMFTGIAGSRQSSLFTSHGVDFPLNISHSSRNRAIMLIAAPFRHLGGPHVHALHLRTGERLKIISVFLMVKLLACMLFSFHILKMWLHLQQRSSTSGPWPSSSRQKEASLILMHSRHTYMKCSSSAEGVLKFESCDEGWQQ